MTFKLATLATLGLAALAVTAPASAEQSKGDEQLAKLLEGRVAGEPTRCVPSHVNARIYMIDKTALVYDAGRTIYINYTAHPEALDSNDMLVIRDATPSFCRTSRVEMRRSYASDSLGYPIFLTDFIPYKRASD